VCEVESTEDALLSIDEVIKVSIQAFVDDV
jgi:hypothetical protein